MSRYNRGGKSGFGTTFLATLMGGLMLIGLAVGGIALHNHFNEDTPTEEVEQEKTEDNVEVEDEVETETPSGDEVSDETNE